MTDLFHAVAECRDLIDHWDVTGRPDGVFVRVRSRECFPDEGAAVSAVREAPERITPPGYAASEVTTTARANGAGSGWHGYVEMLVSSTRLIPRGSGTDQE